MFVILNLEEASFIHVQEGFLCISMCLSSTVHWISLSHGR